MNKKANKKGFTIMEMLIVVAIIAVLVAIAIPTFNGALTKSKEAADVANIRAAYAEVMVEYLTDDAAAIPNKAGFVAKVGALNYDSEDVFTYPTDGTSKTITYKATKLKTEAVPDGVYTWELPVAPAKPTV